MKDKSPIATEGLLKYWESEAYKKLSDQNNTSYHVEDYITELDTNIAAVAALLHHGMELSMYIASSESMLIFLWASRDFYSATISTSISCLCHVILFYFTCVPLANPCPFLFPRHHS